MKTPLPCPECGNPYVLSYATVLVMVGPGSAGYLWGDPSVVLLPKTFKAFCNSDRCGWEGAVADVRE